MRIATLARKPITLPNVARNILTHWAGAINIDQARVPRQEDYFEKCVSVIGLGSNNGAGVYGEWSAPRASSWNELGCWPANVVLLHSSPTCSEAGCQPGCPCVTLHDKARYFKQLQNESELLDYLQKHLSPPGEKVLVAPQSASWDPEPFCPGLVVPWEPSKETLERWFRLLRPGAHLVILSEDGIETGCTLEDAGYEIRDAILVAEDSQGLHYCAKPSARERNAGVPYSKAKIKVWRYFPTDEIDTHCPPEGFTEDEVPPDLAEFFVPKEVELTRRHSNYHATVKPIALMSMLMAGLPPRSLVVDPFLGSGTTAIAALNRGFCCIGIEQDQEEGYIQIALARVEFWCPSYVVVRSEVPCEEPEFELWR